MFWESRVVPQVRSEVVGSKGRKVVLPKVTILFTLLFLAKINMFTSLASNTSE